MSFKDYSIDVTKPRIKNQETTGTTVTNQTTAKPKYRFVMGEKKRKAEAAGQKFTDTWKPPKQTEDYFPEPISIEAFNALNPDGGNSNSLSSLSKAMREGTRIRNNLKNVLSQYGNGKYSGNVFDNIDDDTIEKNIPLAQQALSFNKKRTPIGKIQDKYPNYKDAMAMLYAADEKSDKNALNAAKFAAYLENKAMPKVEPKVEIKTQSSNELLKPTGIKLFTDNISADDIDKAVANNKKGGSLFSKTDIQSSSASSKKYEFDDINGIIARAEKIPSGLKKEERDLLEAVLKNTSTSLQMRKRIENILAKPEAKITEADPSLIHSSVRIRHELTEDLNTKVKNYIKSQTRQLMNDTFTLSAGTRLVDGVNKILNSSGIAQIIGNPELNYHSNKKIDLSETGAMKGIYINDQNKLKEYDYGIKDIDWGGCGIVAMYNVLQGLNKPMDFAELIRENEETALLKGVLGTSPYGLTKYLRDKGLEVTTDYTKVKKDYDTSGADAVIHLYFRSDFSAHYVAGISNGDGTFCFYNSSTGITSPMTWEEYYEKNIEIGEKNVVYGCAYNIRK